MNQASEFIEFSVIKHYNTICIRYSMRDLLCDLNNYA